MNSNGSTAASDSGRYQELCQRAQGTSVNDRTLLATDYLNCLNEICMLLEMVPDAPDCFEDCREWHLLSYTEHFQQSHIADAKLALEAYPYSPSEYRRAFEHALKNAAQTITLALAELEEKIKIQQIDNLHIVTEEAVARLQQLIAMMGSIINGEVMSQDMIDKLLVSES